MNASAPNRLSAPRTGSVCFALLAAAALVCALSFEPLHARHDCTGDDCPVCAVIQLVHSALRSLTSAPLCVALMPLAFLTARVRFRTSAAHGVHTPVAQKVRMND